MRKLLLCGALAAIGMMLIATAAFASFDSHFTVHGHDFKLHQVSKHRFEWTVKLKKRGSRVGNAAGRCHDARHHQNKCRIRYHLNGKVGGRGNIHAFGEFGPGPERFNVTGGTGDFDGVAGKIVLTHTNKSEFHLVK